MSPSRIQLGLNQGGKNDNFYTPNSLAKRLISYVPIEIGSTVLDPFSGIKKPFYNNFPVEQLNLKIKQYEISDGTNAFNQKTRFDWIITNPPFSDLGKTLEWTINVARIGFAYVLPLHSLSHNRIAWLESTGWFITGFYTFENPKKWQINFPHAFVIWTRNSNARIGTTNQIVKPQGKLFCEECGIVLINTTNHYCSQCEDLHES